MRPLCFAPLVLLAFAVLGCPKNPAVVGPPPVEASADLGPPPIEVPQRDGPRVVVVPMRLVRAALFPEEVQRLERWVARHLGLQGELVLGPLPPEEVDAFEARLEEGRLDEHGPRCLAAMPVRLSVEHAFKDAYRARATADCSSQPCKLTVDVFTPDGSPAVAWSAEVPGEGTFADWEKAAQRLAAAGAPAIPPEPQERTFEAAQTDERVVITHMDAVGDWSWRPAPDDLEGAKNMVNQCHEAGHVPTGPTLAVLELAEDGGVRRCTAQSWRDPPLEQQQDCYCHTLSGVRLGEGARGRRLAIELQERPHLSYPLPEGGRILGSIEGFKSSDPAIRPHWVVSALPWVAMCYATTLRTDEMSVSAHFTLDARGQVVKAAFGGVDASEPLGACMTGYLRNVVLPCPFSGIAELQFTVRVKRMPAAKEGPSSSSRRLPSGPTGSLAANPG